MKGLASAIVEERLVHPHGQVGNAPGGWRLPTAIDHRRIGVLTIATAAVFLVIGCALALLLRAQLAAPAGELLGVYAYNRIFTLHGVVGMFLFAVPAMQGAAIRLLPPMLGAADLPFPRLAACAYWLYALGGIALCATLLLDGGPDGGWLMPAPLSGYQYAPGPGEDLWLAGIALFATAGLANAIHLLVAVLRMRAPGMSLARLPVYAWSVAVGSALAVLGYAPLLAGGALLALERALHWPYFLPEKGGAPLLWAQLAAAFVHPLVLSVFLPAAGMVSMLIPVLARTRLVGRAWIIWALLATGVIGLLVWIAQLLGAVSQGPLPGFPALGALALAFPVAVHLAAWTATLARGQVRASMATLYLAGFLFCLAAGGLSALLLALDALGVPAAGSYLAIAQQHYLLVGGLLFPLAAVLYHCAPRGSAPGRSRWLGWVTFALVFSGVHLAFVPLYALGLLGMPRRVQTYAAGLGWDSWNTWASAGAALLAAGIGLALLDLLLRARARRAASSCTCADSLGALAVRADRRPALGDRLRPAAGESGPHPVHVNVLARPAPTWLPFLAAAASVASAYSLALRAPGPAATGWALALVVLFAWAWRCDRTTNPVPPGRGMPGTLVPRATPTLRSRCAVLLALAADACVFLVLVAACTGLAGARPGPWPPLAQPLPILTSGAGAVILWATGSAMLSYSGTSGTPARTSVGLLAALTLNLLALMLCAYGVVAPGLDPQADGYAALLAAVLSYQGLHAMTLCGMVLYLVARVLTGLHDGAASRDGVHLFFHYTVMQGAVAVALLYLYPRLAL